MQYPKLRFALVLLGLTALFAVLPATAAKGTGIIVEGNVIGTDNIGPLNPILCNDPYCRRITDFLFPTLYAVDPQTGLLAEAAAGNYGLAVDTTAPTAETSIIKLRDDLVWSDGLPITAYDVFYSYLAIVSDYIGTPYYRIGSVIKAARVVDDHSIEFAYTNPNCSTPAQINFPIVPAHVFDPRFQKMATEMPPPTGDDLDEWFSHWLIFYPPERFTRLNNPAFNAEPTVSAGHFQFAERLPGQEIRLKTTDGALAFVYRDIPAGMNEVQYFLTGQSNVLVNPPLPMRDDLLADPEISVAQMPGDTWTYIGLNTANPALPRSAADGNGKLLEQGHHPLFGDVRVRQAIQKAIDVRQLINTSLLGYGLPLLSSRIPGSWAANDTLQAPKYDLDAAADLLTQAGWIDHDGDGTRECNGCLYASQGRGMYFQLDVANGDGREVAADLISRQLGQIGISVSVNVTDEGALVDEVRYQQFDAYMTGQPQDFPTDADQTSMFTRAGDVLYGGGNYGSYTNPDVEKLTNQALTLPGCDTNARADIYRNIQGLLQNDQPYIWLYATQDMLVTQGIIGVAPYPNRPLWNIQDWIVAS